MLVVMIATYITGHGSRVWAQIQARKIKRRTLTASKRPLSCSVEELMSKKARFRVHPPLGVGLG